VSKRRRPGVGKRKRPGAGDRKLPLNSPNWMPLTDAYRQGKARLGPSDFAIADLQRGLRGQGDQVRSKYRLLIDDGKDVEELLDVAFWHDFRLTRWNEGLHLVALADRRIDGNAVVYVWKPDIEKIWPPEAAATPSSENTQRHKPGPKHRDEWPNHVGAWLIRIARDEPDRLGNVDQLTKDASQFLDNENILAPQDHKRLRPVIAGFLRYVR
jgi:hypothetical protein